MITALIRSSLALGILLFPAFAEGLCVRAFGADATTINIEKDKEQPYVRRASVDGKLYRFELSRSPTVFVQSKDEWTRIAYKDVPNQLREVIGYMGIVIVESSSYDSTVENVWLGTRRFKVDKNTGAVSEEQGGRYRTIDAELLPVDIRQHAFLRLESDLEELILDYKWRKIADFAGEREYAEKFRTPVVLKSLIERRLKNLGIHSMSYVEPQLDAEDKFDLSLKRQWEKHLQNAVTSAEREKCLKQLKVVDGIVMFWYKRHIQDAAIPRMNLDGLFGEEEKLAELAKGNNDIASLPILREFLRANAGDADRRLVAHRTIEIVRGPLRSTRTVTVEGKSIKLPTVHYQVRWRELKPVKVGNETIQGRMNYIISTSRLLISEDNPVGLKLAKPLSINSETAKERFEEYVSKY